MDFEKRLAELFIELPEVPKNPPAVVAAHLENKTLYVGQCLPLTAGKLAYKGRLGIEVSLDQGRLAARHALLIGLSAIRQTLGSFQPIKSFIQLTGFIASSADFQDQERVLEGASKLLEDIFGSAGKHTRIAVGVNQLPLGACVSLSMIAAVK